ncbi:elongation factor P--(R)-beta-lysine ligase [Alteromonas sp. CYL-A6]|uniref:elongation factor P--(R)-beta-lysine ligase n=1 Tax=Alteromonas nitratireducens TaxID=3390813 RepID=UPI0034B8D2DB
MNTSRWSPTTTHDARVARAALLRDIRAFFDARGVLEVDTPLLSGATVTDVYLDPFETVFRFDESGKPKPFYLQTSPEYAMKRLLCAGSGPIYQLCKAFRHEGYGRWHNPEFTMLEWYRPGFDHRDLMNEIDALLQAVIDAPAARYQSYQQAFSEHVGIDPLSADREQKVQALITHNINIDNVSSLTDDDILQLLFSLVVEPAIGQHAPCFIYGFPASQAALARLNQDDPRTADRFELYYRGAELANGFYELSDAQEQRRRFEQDNAARRDAGLPERAPDEHLLAALTQGMPDCAGVAMGVDRLLMIKTGARHIRDVINFPVNRA